MCLKAMIKHNSRVNFILLTLLTIILIGGLVIPEERK